MQANQLSREGGSISAGQSTEQRGGKYKSRPINCEQRGGKYKCRPINCEQRGWKYKCRPINFEQRGGSTSAGQSTVSREGEVQVQANQL